MAIVTPLWGDTTPSSFVLCMCFKKNPKNTLYSHIGSKNKITQKNVYVLALLIMYSDYYNLVLYCVCAFKKNPKNVLRFEFVLYYSMLGYLYISRQKISISLYMCIYK